MVNLLRKVKDHVRWISLTPVLNMVESRKCDIYMSEIKHQ